MPSVNSSWRRSFPVAVSLAFLLLASLSSALAASTPVSGSPADDSAKLAGLLALAQRAQATADDDDRQQLWAEFLDESAQPARRHPEQIDLWAFRATAALELNRGKSAREAAQHLLRASAPDDAVRLALSRLVARGWTEVVKVRTSLPPGPPAPGKLAGRKMRAGETGIKLHWIPPGTFRMGTTPTDSTGRLVHITRGFWLGETEVTQAQWTDFMGRNPSNFQQAARLREEMAMTIIGDDRPVEQVSWNQAMAFCRKLTDDEDQAGHLPPGYEYRLPTEAEWEYAARAGVTGDYPGDLDGLAWFDGNAHNSTHDVGGKKANAWGLRDMAGNVAEWCYDWYQNLDSDETTDWAVLDRNPDEPTATRVIRGGSWLTVAPRCEPSYRTSDDPGNTVSYVGFRLALAPIATAK